MADSNPVEPIVVPVLCSGTVHHLSVERGVPAENLDINGDNWNAIELVDHHQGHDIDQVLTTFGGDAPYDVCTDLAGWLLHNIYTYFVFWARKRGGTDELTIAHVQVGAAVAALQKLRTIPALLPNDLAANALDLMGSGMTTAEEVYRWWLFTGDVDDPKRCLVTPEAAPHWYQAGLAEPGAWIAEGVTAADATRLEGFGMSPALWKDWSDLGFQPASAVGWLTVGVLDPVAARAATDAGVTFEQVAAAARELGISGTKACQWLTVAGSAEKAQAWMEVGQAGPAAVRSLIRRGMPPDAWRKLVGDNPG